MADTESNDSAEKAFAAAVEESSVPKKSEPSTPGEPEAIDFPTKSERQAAPTPAPAATPAEPEAPVAKPEEPVVAKAPAQKAAPVKKAPVKKAPAKKAAAAKATTPAKKPAAKRAPVRKPAATAKPAAPAKSATPAQQPAAVAAKATPVSAPTKPAISKIKDKTMSKTSDFTASIKKSMSEGGEKAKEAFEKGKAVFGEAGEFTKGNVEAMMESGKILANGMKDMGEEFMAESKTAIETMTEDAKAFSTVKSPTDFVKLQGDIARRNIDTAIATSTKNGEAMLKLMGDAFAPISARFSLAMDKVKKAA